MLKGRGGGCSGEERRKFTDDGALLGVEDLISCYKLLDSGDGKKEAKVGKKGDGRKINSLQKGRWRD